MTLFTNPNFIDHIVRSQGLQLAIEQEHFPSLQTLIELETRNILETATKFMRRDRRDAISLQDVELAAREHSHNDMIVAPFGSYLSKEELIVKEDKMYASPSKLMEEQLKALGVRKVAGPQLTGRWIFLKGKVPSLSENINIKRMQQLSQSQKHEREQKRKLWNIIKDEPYSYLNAEQSEYFLALCRMIASDSAPNGNMLLDGDLNSLMPFLLKFLGSSPINQTGIAFLLQLLENKYVWQAVEYGTVKALNLLLAYKGPQSFQVGVKIAQIVQNLCEKYRILLDIFVDYQDESYSTILKKIPFELYLGVPFNLTEQVLLRCREDAENNDQLAILCMRTLLEHSSQLTVFKRLLARRMNTFVFWHPCADLRDDPHTQKCIDFWQLTQYQSSSNTSIICNTRVGYNYVVICHSFICSSSIRSHKALFVLYQQTNQRLVYKLVSNALICSQTCGGLMVIQPNNGVVIRQVSTKINGCCPRSSCARTGD